MDKGAGDAWGDMSLIDRSLKISAGPKPVENHSFVPVPLPEEQEGGSGAEGVASRIVHGARVWQEYPVHN